MIGMSSAWYLAEDGHEVTVIDRQAGPGLETSFAGLKKTGLRPLGLGFAASVVICSAILGVLMVKG